MKYQKIKCEKCDREISSNNIKKHTLSCGKYKLCPICGEKFYTNGITCSYSCSNKYFRSGKNNGNWKDDVYQTTCFLHHKKKCLVCDETKIVSVHHVNEDRTDNRPENLVPLCPTHHQYVHSRYRNEVQPYIDEYLKNYLGVAQSG